MNIVKSKNRFFSFKFLPIIIVFILFLLVLPSFGGEHLADGKRISMNVKDKSLTEVLSDIAEQSGYTIILNSKRSKDLVSVSFDNLTLSQSLRRVFGVSNSYTVIDEDRKKVTLNIVDSGATSKIEPFVASSASNDYSSPPEPDEIEAIQASLPKVDPMDNEVVPPATNVGRSLTLRELKATQASLPEVDPMSNEVVPPTTNGGQSLTLRELKAIQASLPIKDPMAEEVVPSTNPAGITTF